MDEAIDMIHAGYLEEAVQLLMQAADTNNITTKLEVAQVFLELGQQEKTRTIINEILEIEPGNSDAKLILADVLIDENEDEQAIQLLNEIEEEDENYIQALIQLADLYQVQGLFEVAESKLLTAKNLVPSEPVIDFGLGELFFSLGEYHRATIYYEKLLNSYQEFGGISILDRLAEAFALNGEFEKALEYYQKIDSKNPETLFRYGFLAYRAERYEIAIQAWRQLLEEELEYPSVYLYLSQAYEEEGMMEEAIQTANKGVEMDPLNKEMWYVAGKISLKMGHKKEAFERAHRAIALDNEYQEALLFLAEAYKNNEEYDKLIHLLTQEVQLESLSGVFHWELAQAYYEKEMYKEALKSYQNAYNMLKEDADFLKDYGYFLVEEGRIEQAISTFQSYLRMEPSDFDTRSYVERLITQNDETLF